MIRGVDVSSWQAGIDFAQLAREGYEFAIVKRSGGTSYKNPYFRNQVAAAQAAGLEVAAYHYGLEPTGDPAGGVEEADYFNSTLPDDWTFPIALDWEERDTPDHNRWIRDFRLRCRDQWRRELKILYTGNYMIQEHDIKAADHAAMDLWLASWQATLPPVPAGGPWRAITIWQHDSRTEAGGIFPVDVNQFLAGGRAEFRALASRDGIGGVQVIKPSVVPIEYREELPTGHHIHPYFWATWDLARHGYPLGPAALYDDGRVRQLFERVVLGSNGRDEPVPHEGLGQAYHWATGRTIVDWPSVHPLVAEGVR